MLRQQGAVGAGVLVGLLLLSGPGQADEAGAVAAIEKLRGKVTVDAKRPDKPVVAVYLDQCEVTDALMKAVKELKNLESLELSRSHTTVTGEKLKELKELK